MRKKYEVRRSYMVTCVTSIEADTEEEAVRIAKTGDVYWKEYDGDYIEECDFDCDYEGEANDDNR